ncbi:hypothetical protein Nepgr_012965 [Nepenthes gracilis]|uniref:Uncharacterized protein n=1 Tax=Nepenthes gracilis TaxID=150966 RepID=A0AAD3SI74_NEPGR|nr:hypothetical protein Nepgr_012965 [Nepenthes gracilis]
MGEKHDEDFNSKSMSSANYIYQPPTLAYIKHRSSTFSCSMKRSVRSLFSAILLVVIGATVSCRLAVRGGFGSIYPYCDDGDVENHLSNTTAFDFPLFNSTLLKLAEIDAGELQFKRETQQLLEGNLVDQSRYLTHFLTWFRLRGIDLPIRSSRRTPASIQSREFNRVWIDFRRNLNDWARKKGFQNDIMLELIDLVKVPIDRHNNGLLGVSKRKYSSCAVVGNSGILLNSEHGELIDSHEVVIRLNNARIESFKRNVGSKTSISFINSNIFHLCSRREGCSCHPYGTNVPIVMYICQPVHFLDYTLCSSSHKSPLLITDSRFDVLCARLVKFYSLKRFAEESKNKTLEQWELAHDGSMFHYSSGMQAVLLAVGICDRVSLFGFGKSTSAKHHYHTNQKAELSLHDYEAEHDFYRDLVERPELIPFISTKFKFPPVVIHH